MARFLLLASAVFFSPCWMQPELKGVVSVVTGVWPRVALLALLELRAHVARVGAGVA